MKKGIKAILALVVFVGLTGNVFAKEDPQFELGKRAVSAAGVAVTAVNPGKDFRGNEALVMTTNLSPNQVLDKFAGAIANGKQLDGVSVIGMAYMVQRQAWTVTLQLGEEMCSIKIKATDKGSEILVKGKHKAHNVEEEPAVTDPGTVK